MPTEKPSRLTRELLEMAEAQHRLGITDAATREKIVLPHLGDQDSAAAEPITGDELDSGVK